MELVILTDLKQDKFGLIYLQTVRKKVDVYFFIGYKKTFKCIWGFFCETLLTFLVCILQGLCSYDPCRCGTPLPLMSPGLDKVMYL